MSHTYSHYVTEGRKLLEAVEVHQCMIGFFATQVCTLKHGGRTPQGRYTLQKYAADIGANRKTLSQWVATYRDVIEALGMDPSKVTGPEWSLAQETQRLLRKRKRAIQDQLGIKRAKGRGWEVRAEVPVSEVRDLYDQARKGRTPESLIHGYTDTLLYMRGKIRGMDLGEVPVEALKMYRDVINELSTEVTQHLLHGRSITEATA